MLECQRQITVKAGDRLAQVTDKVVSTIFYIFAPGLCVINSLLNFQDIKMFLRLPGYTDAIEKC